MRLRARYALEMRREAFREMRAGAWWRPLRPRARLRTHVPHYYYKYIVLNARACHANTFHMPITTRTPASGQWLSMNSIWCGAAYVLVFRYVCAPLLMPTSTSFYQAITTCDDVMSLIRADFTYDFDEGPLDSDDDALLLLSGPGHRGLIDD